MVKRYERDSLLRHHDGVHDSGGMDVHDELFLSETLSQKPNCIQPYLDDIIRQPSAEIRYMKYMLQNGASYCKK